MRTKFAEKFLCKHGTFFRRICELDFVRRRTKAQPYWGVTAKKDRTREVSCLFLEAPPRFGLGIEVLQTFALPLGHGAIFSQQMDYITKILSCQGGFCILFDFIICLLQILLIKYVRY